MGNYAIKNAHPAPCVNTPFVSTRHIITPATSFLQRILNTRPLPHTNISIKERHLTNEPWVNTPSLGTRHLITPATSFLKRILNAKFGMVNLWTAGTGCSQNWKFSIRAGNPRLAALIEICEQPAPAVHKNEISKFVNRRYRLFTKMKILHGNRFTMGKPMVNRMLNKIYKRGWTNRKSRAMPQWIVVQWPLSALTAPGAFWIVFPGFQPSYPSYDEPCSLLRQSGWMDICSKCLACSAHSEGTNNAASPARVLT